MGTLYYGDNLDILRRYLKDETVDLVYLDPPFNSAQNYNAFFHEKDGTDAASQIRAFEDTWSWNQESQSVYEELILQPGKVSEVMQAFRTFLGTNDMMAYLAMMAPRLVELRRVLKPTGSLYLHCDPTASHYLKLLCDAVFRSRELPETKLSGSEPATHSDCETVVGPVQRHHPLLQQDRRATLGTRLTPSTPRNTSRRTTGSTTTMAGPYQLDQYDKRRNPRTARSGKPGTKWPVRREGTGATPDESDGTVWTTRVARAGPEDRKAVPIAGQSA